MIIDFHTHTFPEKIAEAALARLSAASRSRAFTKGTETALLASAEAAGIDLCVVQPVATNPEKVARINELAAKGNRGGGVLSFGCIHPAATDALSQVDYAAELGLPGLKLHPVYQGVAADDVRTVRILERAREKGLLVLFHAGDDIGFPGDTAASPEKLRRAVLESGAGESVVMAHMGGWKNWERVADALLDTGVYLDTSFSLGRIPGLCGAYSPEEERLLDPHFFCEMVRTFGSERILFGTDSPWTSQAESLAAIRALDLTKKEKDDILGESAKRLLKL
ncbi:MAG: amidohydrolase family protein [Clostridia bacterium]|nr:amidohydrolase family protein [Clostridia bacterium]